MSRPTGQLEKSLAALTIGVHQARERRRSALTDTELGEWENQVHVPITGQAGNQLGYTDAPVQFSVVYTYAPTQRPVDFGGPQPHFTHGIEFTSPTPTAVLIFPHIIAWKLSESNWCIGATVRFGVIAPLATELVPFAAMAHLSFEGWGAIPEGEEFG